MLTRRLSYQHVGGDAVLNAGLHLTYLGTPALSVCDVFVLLPQVFVYYRAMSKPVAKRHFGAPAGGGGEGGQFISAVCWKPRSRTLLAATSLGVVKVMQLTS